MFNGIVFNTGEIKILKKNKNSILIGIKTKLKFKKKDLGSSINCNGVCLTLFKINNKLIFFYISNETLKRSNFKNIKKGQKINIEKSLTYGQKISSAVERIGWNEREIDEVIQWEETNLATLS